MKRFKGELTLIKNSRGCYIMDTVKGCSIVNAQPRGCYDDCYAQRIAARYKLDFGKTVNRELIKDDPAQPNLFGFRDEGHLNRLIKQISAMDMPFVRIGEMGDPSWDWEHTLTICEQLKDQIWNKQIVIVTKHWTTIPNKLLHLLAGICINTSVSALDEEEDIQERIWQYERLKPHCKSVLRVVSCDFNKENGEGLARSITQNSLLKHEHVIDTIFRPSPDNPFLVRGVIKAEPVQFLKSKVLASVRNPSTYFGHCSACSDMCGATI